ncbi:type VI secretion system baseplate subunit TssE [Nannocystis sp.]|uniref:type VI secretion system baseplate subunit TssE n=1 Tax=Nannocystis sp. TaxID=1962667 RepID=UPI00242258C6|nr:type VI secretion system baseplate subunit TssE [Nannocystis sp.]MBK7825163.1 type VI secretion system baseplate subunit TssE [Nannocystis sp.]MBK9756975.1 type VI secretion system baseplate subunit TssE [Nannocystis sp.]
MPITDRTAPRGLLTRLQGLPGDDELSSVLANLRLLFNTRPGDSPAAPDFGVPDLADLLHQFPAASTALQHGLRAAIARHEPRLRGVQVRSGGPHSLEIDAQLAGVPLRLRALLTPSGRIDLG